MIFFIDESGTRAFNDGDDLMESLGNTRTGINFVMVDGQGTLIGTGSNDKSLMKSIQLIKKTHREKPYLCVKLLRELQLNQAQCRRGRVILTGFL